MITANFQKVIDEIKKDVLTRPQWEQDYLKNRGFSSKQQEEICTNCKGVGSYPPTKLVSGGMCWTCRGRGHID